MQELEIETISVKCTHSSSPILEVKGTDYGQDPVVDTDSDSDANRNLDSDMVSSLKPALVSRTQRKPLGGPYERHNIITLTPDSSPLPSPTSECSNTSPFFELGPDLSQHHQPTYQFFDPASIPGTINTLNYLYSIHAPWSTIQPYQSALLTHLHDTPVTLADVHALIPHLLYDKQVMNKLATNIGRHSARSTISAPDVEEMLIHILVSSDWESALFSRTKDQIERFRREREEWVRGRAMEKVCVRKEEFTRKKHVDIPAEFQDPLICLPDRNSNFAHLVANVDALSLDGGGLVKKVGMSRKAVSSFAQTRVCDGGVVVRGRGRKPKIRLGVPNGRGKGVGKKDRKAGQGREVQVRSTAWMKQKEKEKEMRVEVQTAALANVLFKYRRGGKEKVRTIAVKMPEG